MIRSSSLSDLAAHTDSIKTHTETVLTISRRVADESTRHTISESIGASLSKMELLSHQLCQVAKIKLKHCQGGGMWIQYNKDFITHNSTSLNRSVRGGSCSC